MAEQTENTFGNIQLEERYKKLERTLKLFMLRQNDKKTFEADSPWQSVSSIHGDNLDTSTGFSQHSSRMESEVLASSRDMRKIIQNRQNFPENQPKMTTSSVKQFPMTPSQTEKILMPPPKSVNILAHSSRRNSLVSSGNRKPGTPTRAAGTDREFAAQSVISSIKYSSSGNNTSQIQFDRENYENHDHSNVQEKPDRIFTRWRPVLNDKGQLIIKGTLECGKIARSKPVIRRLSATSVQSIFKHIYHLDGNIYDERHELPDYIRGKFFNGFPEDWENVHQIWSNYVAGGCKENYRWPTRVTDSDDDIKSEITDISVVKKPKKRSQQIEREIKDYPRSPSKQLDLNHENSSDNRKALEKDASMHQQEVKENPSHNKSFRCCCGKETNAQHPGAHGDKDTMENIVEKTKGQQLNCSTLSSTPSTISRIISLKDIIYEDKLKIIIDNLTSKKCSIEYIDKIIEMFDFLKFAVSYQSEDSPPTPPLEVDREPCNSSRNCQEHSKREQCSTQPKPIVNRSAEAHENHFTQKKQLVRRKLSKNDYASSGDENSPVRARSKLPTRPLIEKPLTELRSTESKPCDDVLIINNDKNCPIPNNDKKYNNNNPNQRIDLNDDSSVSFTEDERRPIKIQTHSHTPRKMKDNYDSSVSIIEDENTDNVGKRVETKKSVAQNGKVIMTADIHTPMKIHQKEMNPGNFVDQLENIEPSTVPSNDNSKDVSRGQDIRQKSLDNTSVENNKTNKPTIVNIEKVSINLPTLPKKPREISPRSSTPEAPGNINKVVLPELRDKDLRIELRDIAKDKASKKFIKNTKDDDKNEKGGYGTLSNPKSLSNWVPRLLKKPGENNYVLIFEGKLVNEAGHIVTRKFSTATIVKRINPRIIESEDNTFYQLVGELSDTKHTLPKEIQKMCLKGCPGRINSFCEKWKKIIEQTSPEKNQNLNGSTIDMNQVPTSSRGRRILPPLSYWTGERVTLKDNTPVYSPGNSQQASIPSSLEMSFRKDTSQNSSRKRDTSAKDTSNSAINFSIVKEKEESISNTKKSPVKAIVEKNIKETKKSTSLKRRSRKEVKDDSSDADEALKPSKVKRRRKKDISPPADEGAKERKAEIVNINGKKEKLKTGGKSKPTELIATYRSNVPYRDECALSDDQSSIMM
uniref:SANTA domain-containing protein n=1 Tax=Bracon brevicornis TaxID=1563983 RepID=A0A6V7LHC8_9HYME